MLLVGLTAVVLVVEIEIVVLLVVETTGSELPIETAK